MSRFAGMSSNSRRAWGIGLVVFFVLLFVMIGVSQWYAVHVNVPKYEAQFHGKPSQ